MITAAPFLATTSNSPPQPPEPAERAHEGIDAKAAGLLYQPKCKWWARLAGNVEGELEVAVAQVMAAPLVPADPAGRHLEPAQPASKTVERSKPYSVPLRTGNA